MTGTVAEHLDRLGEVFAVFGEETQDSGHVSYGVQRPDGRRRFVKTAGGPQPTPGGLSHADRVAVLRRAASIQAEVSHPALVPLHEVVEARDGVLVVQDWFTGELLFSPAERRADPREAGVRFRRLPFAEAAAALDAVIDLHVRLEEHGWIAGDLYDGCLMYDFASSEVRVIDLEHYRRGPYPNEVGRLPGSRRFMAPEEHTRGATIDARTTVFNLGRTVDVLLAEHPRPWLSELVAATTAERPDDRPPTVAALQAAWRAHHRGRTPPC